MMGPGMAHSRRRRPPQQQQQSPPCFQRLHAAARRSREARRRAASRDQEQGAARGSLQLIKNFSAAEAKVVKFVDSQCSSGAAFPPRAVKQMKTNHAAHGPVDEPGLRRPARRRARPKPDRPGPERGARHPRAPTGSIRSRRRAAPSTTLTGNVLAAMTTRTRPGRVADSTGNWVDTLAPVAGCGPICGSRAPTGRSAPGCC